MFTMASKKVSKHDSSRPSIKNDSSEKQWDLGNVDHFSSLSHELLYKIMSSLPLREVVCLSLQSNKLKAAVELYFGLCKRLHLAEGHLFGYLPMAITDKQLMALLSKCPKVEYIYGLNPRRIERRPLRGSTRIKLTISGVITALSICKNLKGVETSHLELMESILHQLPHIKIVGHFRNHNGRFPTPNINRLQLPDEPLLTSLHLTGIELPELPSIPTIEYLYLQWVRFTKAQPFQHFSSPALRTFVMRHCVGPGNPLRFIPLAFALAGAVQLKRLELVGMSFLGRLLQRVTEDNLQKGSFTKLEKLIFGACSNIVETDVGYIMLASNATVTDVSLQPSLSRDSLFLSLKMAEVVFAKLQSCYVGFVDDFPRKVLESTYRADEHPCAAGQWNRADLLAFGLDDILELPAPVTDVGMKNAGILFPNLKKLLIYNCPHLVKPTQWYKIPDDRTSWCYLQDLTLSHCHCLRLEDFLLFLAYLPAIETLVLEDVFREPPKGCSYVGLSAGTGLGMSSAIVSNQQELIAVNGNDMEAAAALQNVEHALDADVYSDESDEYLSGHESEDDVLSTERSSLNQEEPPASSRQCRHCGLSVKSEKDSPIEPGQPSTSSECCCIIPSEFNKMDVDESGNASYNKVEKRPNDQIFMSDKECFAKVEEIKQDVQWAASLGEGNVTKEGKKVLDGRASRFKPASKTLEQKKAARTLRSVEKAMGTSDPILEDDYEQNLKIMSETLLSLTVISCGISDICLRHCPKIENLEVESCRILHRIRLRRCSSLVKVSISQCPKLDAVRLTKDMGQLPAKQNRMLFFQPICGTADNTEKMSQQINHAFMLSKFYPAEVERTILQSTLKAYNVCVIWDDGSTRDFRLLHRQIVYRWLSLISKINRAILGKYVHVKNPPITSNLKDYPWGRNLYRIHGDLQDGGFEVCADMPWIRELWSAPHIPAARWPHSTGLYRPEHNGHTSPDICIALLKDSIPEYFETNPHLALHTFAVYMHVGRDDSY